MEDTSHSFNPSNGLNQNSLISKALNKHFNSKHLKIIILNANFKMGFPKISNLEEFTLYSVCKIFPISELWTAKISFFFNDNLSKSRQYV